MSMLSISFLLTAITIAVSLVNYYLQVFSCSKVMQVFMHKLENKIQLKVKASLVVTYIFPQATQKVIHKFLSFHQLSAN